MADSKLSPPTADRPVTAHRDIQHCQAYQHIKKPGCHRGSMSSLRTVQKFLACGAQQPQVPSRAPQHRCAMPLSSTGRLARLTLPSAETAAPHVDNARHSMLCQGAPGAPARACSPTCESLVDEQVLGQQCRCSGVEGVLTGRLVAWSKNKQHCTKGPQRSAAR